MEQRNKIWLIILLAVIVYVLMGIYADSKKLVLAMKFFQWKYFFALLIFATLNWIIRFLKWNYFLKKAGIYLKLKDNLFIFFSGFSMNITPGKIGEIWKGWLIRDIKGEELSKSIPVIIVERITDVFGLIILSFFGLLYYKKSIYLILILIFIFLSFIIIIKSKTISNRIILKLETKMKKYIENIKTMHETFEILVDSKGLIGISLFSAFGWFFECLGLYIIVIGFGKYINILLSMFIYSFASLAGAASMIPGGLGITEGTISGLLNFFGLSTTTSIGAAIIVRFGTLWYGTITGLLVYFIFRKKIRKIRGLK